MSKSNNPKIVTIVGARPQFIKSSVISKELMPRGINEIIVHTGQHFDENMSEIFFKELNIPEPKYNLNINSLNHGAMTGRMLEQIEKILFGEKPDYVLVYGDTNSTLAGALAAKKIGIKVIHVEAGLRSYNWSMPEEINRILTDRISDLLFCPSSSSKKILEQEGIIDNVFNSGDIMYDSFLLFSEVSKKYSSILTDQELNQGEYIMATIHRQENTDSHENLEELIEALNIISKKRCVVMPMHPRTKSIVESMKITCNFKIIDPVGYPDSISLLKHSILLITDSGGMQKEAYFAGKYCITARHETEWNELVEKGYNYLAGTDKEKIVDLTNQLSEKTVNFKDGLYGNGKTAVFITKKILEHFNC